MPLTYFISPDFLPFPETIAWILLGVIDTGTFESLHQACTYIHVLERRQGLKVGCPEEVAWRKGWISNSELENLSQSLSKNNYGKYLYKLSKMN